MALGAEKLVRLLDIGSDVKNKPAEFDGDQDKAEQLFDLLSQNAMLSGVGCRKPQTSLVSIKQQVLSVCEESIGALILAPETDVHILRKIKSQFKILAASSTSEAKSSAAMVVYFAAIASALVFHSVRISRLRDEELKEYFVGLLRNGWLTAELHDLFRKTCEVC